MKYFLYTLALGGHLILQGMELNNCIKKYESSDNEKFSIFVPDIKPSLSIYNICNKLITSEWIGLFQTYKIDPITANYVFLSIKNEKILAKEIWCHIFQFLKYDQESKTFVLHDAQWRCTGYISKEQLTKKIFSFSDFDIEMSISNDRAAKLKLKNREFLNEKGELLIEELRKILEKANLIGENTGIHADCNTQDEHNNRQIILSFFYQYPLGIPFFCTSFADGTMDNQFCSNDYYKKYTNQVTVKINESYSFTTILKDYIRSFYAWCDETTENVWLFIETMDENICLTDEGAHHISYQSLPSKHLIHIYMMSKANQLLKQVQEISLPLLNIQQEGRIDCLFANTRCWVKDIIDGKIIVYDLLKNAYLCYELW